jgi:hypothetical protein
MATERAEITLVLLAMVLIPVACDRTQPRRPRRPDEPTTMPATTRAPAADEQREDEAGSDQMVTDDTVLERYEKPPYVQNVKVLTGTLKGICWIPTGGKRIQLPKPKAIDVAEGPNAVINPMDGEVHYYQQADLKERTWVAYNGRTLRYGVGGAAVILRGIKEGPTPPLPRGLFVTHKGKLYADPSSWGAFDLFTATCVKDRVTFHCYDIYPADIVLKDVRTGKVIHEGRMSGYTGDVDATDLQRTTTETRNVEPSSLATPPLVQIGPYVAMCKRHPWQRAWVIVTDNPYLAITSHKNDGMFTIKQVPVGRWLAEVWHPYLEPVRKTCEVVIEKDEIAELGLAFKPPAYIAEQLDGGTP